MTPPPTNGENATVSSLLTECHKLLNEVARRPNALKLLMGVHHQLSMFSQYKANRKSTHRSVKKQ